MCRMVERYRRANRASRIRLIDEVCEICGYERKYAIKYLNKSIPRKTDKRGRKPEYSSDKELLTVLKRIWLKSGQLCGKRLKEAIPLWVNSYEHNYGILPEETKIRLVRVSAATIDRLLKAYKATVSCRKKTGTKPGSLLKKMIPIRTSNDDIDRPGYLEVDTVAHCGGSMSGSFVWSITYTDIVSAWTYNAPVWSKGSAWVLHQTEKMEKELPFKLIGFDVDNGSEFITHHLYQYLTGRTVPIRFTRSRPYHKNDNAHVEQKNWTHVRELLGYDRLECPAIIQEMEKLYKYSNLMNNFFKPSLKLIEKKRQKSRYIKKYDKPTTPYQRLLKSGIMSPEWDERLSAQFKSLDPFALNNKIQKHLRRIEKMKTKNDLNEGSFSILPPGGGWKPEHRKTGALTMSEV